MSVVSLILYLFTTVALLGYLLVREYLYCKKLIAEREFYKTASAEMKKFD